MLLCGRSVQILKSNLIYHLRVRDCLLDTSKAEISFLGSNTGVAFNSWIDNTAIHMPPESFFVLPKLNISPSRHVLLF